MLHGSVNHVSLTVSDLPQALRFFTPLLEFLGYELAARSQVDQLAELVPQWGGRVTDPPGEYGFTGHGSYYATYFRGPDDIKLECVHMSELERLHSGLGTLHHRLWPHATG